MKGWGVVVFSCPLTRAKLKEYPSSECKIKRTHVNSSHNIKLGIHKGKLKFCEDVIATLIQDEPRAAEEMKECTGLYGAYADSCKTIYLSKGQDTTNLKETLVHELIEASNSILDLQLNHTQIQCLGNFMTALILENKIILSTLTKG